MNAQSRLRDKQRKWADRAGIHYDEAGYVSCLKDNLFEPLNDEMRSEFEGADGGELGGKRKEGERKKMCALHSSSALCCNVFSYLRKNDLLGDFLDVCGLPVGRIASVRFEGRFRITDKHQPARFPRPANLDLVIEYPQDRDLRAVAVESKFTEPYEAHARPLRPAYLDVAELWQGLGQCRTLAAEMARGGAGFVHLDAAQLIKHILALRNNYGPRGSILLYLWYDECGDEAQLHREETDRFAATATADGVRFMSMTYQHLVPALVQRLGAAHKAYLDYLVGRYLA